ncbi:MAG: Ig-like domain-containing protein, partial [Burkholderiales bacterium]|nr:Ig-like domain-containing protein [Burkholderiales bacterium]
MDTQVQRTISFFRSSSLAEQEDCMNNNFVSLEMMNHANNTSQNSSLFSRRRGFWQKAKYLLGSTAALALTVFFLGGAVTPVAAQPVNWATGQTSNWDCNSLYGGRDGRNGIHKYTNPKVDASTTAIITTIPTTSDAYTDTLALGPWPGNDANKDKLVLYMWRYNSEGDDIIYGIFEGDTTLTPIMRKPQHGSSEAWAGGEVNQMTGEIYMTSTEGYDVGTPTSNEDFRLAICNPVTSGLTAGSADCRISAGVRPSTDITLSAGERNASSDMAIDAEGNAYIFIGNSASNKRLIKIVPGANGEIWYYSIVKEIPSFPSAGTSMWGMSFLDGKLYTFGTGGTPLIEVNPLTGASVNRGAPGSGYQLDLTACQVAPVIRGKIYNDANGDGVISDAEAEADGFAGVTVELYRALDGVVTYLGSQQTGGQGEYSFITDSTSDSFYVRVKQPQSGSGANAINLYQTRGFGNADEGATRRNKTTAYCYDGVTSANPLGAEAVCRGGAHLAGSDPDNLATQATGPGILETTFTNDANYFSKVAMTTDKEVAVADFAFTNGRDFSDAPTSFGAAWHVTPTQALADYFLGATVTTQTGVPTDPQNTAGSIGSHDGIEVNIGSAGAPIWRTLQDVMLSSGDSYPIRAKTNEPVARKGYLSAWFANPATVTPTTFPTTSFTNLQSAADGYAALSYVMSSVSNGTGYARFRFSSTSSLPVSGSGQPAAGSNSTAPWVVDGEVEDYRFYGVIGQVIIATSSSGGSGTFGYAFQGVSGTYPSTSSDSITTVAENTYYPQTSSHAFAGTNQQITITQTPPSVEWVLSASCTDRNNNSIAGVTVANHVITIPAAAVTQGATIYCQLNNSKGADPDQSSLTVSPAGPLAANGSQAYTATVTLRNASAQALQNYQASFAVSGGALNTATCTTNASGQCSVQWTSTTESTYSITASALGAPDFASENRAFIKRDRSASGTTITASPASIQANGTSTSTITVQLKNISGINVPESGIVVDFAYDGNALGTSLSSPAQCTTNAQGNCTITLTSGTQTGAVTIKGSIDAEEITNRATVTLTTGGVSYGASGTSLRVNPEKVDVSGGAASATIMVTLRDDQGRPTPAPTGGLAVVLSKAPAACGTLNLGGGTIAQDATQFQTTITGSAACVASITATVGGTAIQNYGEDNEGNRKTAGVVTFYTGIVDLSKSTITAWPGVVVSDGLSYSLVTVQARDAAGEPVGRAGLKVRIDNGGTAGRFFNNNDYYTEGVTDAEGKFEARIGHGLTTGGTATLTATLSGQQVGGAATVIFLPAGTAPNGATLSAYPRVGVKPNTGSSEVKVQLTYNGVPYAQNNRSVGLESGSCATCVYDGGATGVTNQTGAFIRQLRSTADAIATVSATVGGGIVTQPTSLDVEFKGDPPIDKSLAGTSIEADPTAVLVNTGESTVTVQLRNAAGQAVGQQGVPVVLSSSMGASNTITPSTGYTDQHGRATFTLKSSAVGTATITATVDSEAIENSASVRFYKVPPDFGASGTSIAANPTNLEVGNNSTVTVTLRDANGLEVLAENNLTVTFSGSGVGAFVSNTCTITVNTSACSAQHRSTVSGQANATATVFYEGSYISVMNGSPVTITYGSGLPSSAASTIVANPTTVQVTAAQPRSEITVTLKDASGNNATPGTGNTATVTFTLGSSSVGALSSATCQIASTQSTCSVYVTSTAVGTASITASVAFSGATPPSGF